MGDGSAAAGVTASPRIGGAGGRTGGVEEEGRIECLRGTSSRTVHVAP